jgi:cyclopropane fatty-acyl-phospholipid synthase-like methyltransferase
MSTAPASYRWNSSAAAEAYDQAAPAIHPFYEVVQNQILDRLPFPRHERFLLVDLGGGSGRLVERVLQQFDGASAVLVDQSEPFLALAERRLRPFAARVSFAQHRLQADWAGELPAAPDAIVSTSAIHHLEPAEKRSLFARCFATLIPGGVFLNGDEYRPAADSEYRALLEWWSEHMFAALDASRIPSSFRGTVDAWYDRNIRRFGEPKSSGDDCLETIAEQIAALQDAGFQPIECDWKAELWAVLRAIKPSNSA